MNRVLTAIVALALGGTILVANCAPIAEYDLIPAAERRTRTADTELAGRVRGALHASFGTAARDIGVAAQDGFISLYGEVTSEPVRVRAERIAASVAGVRAVNNKLAAARSG